MYDLWRENSIPSVNFRNGRDTVKMRYNKYDCQYLNLKNDKHPVQEKAKHNVKIYVATRRVATYTVQKLKS